MTVHRFVLYISFLTCAHAYNAEKQFYDSQTDTFVGVDTKKATEGHLAYLVDHSPGPHRAQPIFDYIKDQNAQQNKKLYITLANAHPKLQKKFNDGYVSQYSMYAVNFDFKSVLFKLIEAPEDVQRKILEHMGLRSKEVQDSFLHTPLDKALTWYTTCSLQWNLDLYNRSPIEALGCDFDTRFLLTGNQYNCLASILHASTKKPKSKRYVDEETHEDISDRCVLITPKAKKCLLSLPQEFINDSEAANMLKSTIVTEKPSTLSKIVKTPLAMFFYGMRAPFIRPEANFYEQLEIVMPSRIGCAVVCLVADILRSKQNQNPLLFSVFSIIAGQPGFKSMLRFDDNNYYNPYGYPQCIVPYAMHKLKRDAMSFCVVPLVLQLMSMSIRELSIFPGLNTVPYVLALSSMFALWDLYKYGAPKYAVKIQSIAELIEAHPSFAKASEDKGKKQRLQLPCTLI